MTHLELFFTLLRMINFAMSGYFKTKKSAVKYNLSKQGRPPRNSEKGAVRCCRQAMRGYNSGP